ncbi:MAG: GIY-YIG nuclease family protein [Flavobacteriales bacterium]|nr:GIY-YIG nuclease family protein [Flavobacteriales bacterium]HRN43024.1 hypothetical protein [Vicingus sp.]HRP60874.1 hypothetical protein [Vicingus sp.]
MKQVIKKFYTNRSKPDYHFKDILETSFDEFPKNKKGVYILLATSDDKFLYPNREYSPIYYIGMSTNLAKRLNGHKESIKFIKEKHKTKERWDDWYWDRYQYAVSFGCEVIIFTTRSNQKPKDLESEILEMFYNRYLAKPVSNGAFSFRKAKESF